MNRLQKRAWIELVLNLCTLPLVYIAIMRMAHANTQGVGIFIILLIISIPIAIALIIGKMQIWEPELDRFDEREKQMIEKANSISKHLFCSYLLLFSLGIFLLVGGDGSIPVVYMPLMAFTGILICQAAKSGVLLYQCLKDDNE